MKAPIVLLLILAATPALAQDVAPVQTPSVLQQVVPSIPDVTDTPLDDDSIRAIVKGEKRLTKRIFLVLDVSGSMRNENRLGRVLQVVKLVMGQSSDDLEVAIVTFADTCDRWPGFPEPDSNPPLPVGWARLPSAIAVESAQAWILNRASGGTAPKEALRTAIMEPRDDVSVVLVTDGDFPGDENVAVVRRAQRARVAAGRPQVPLMVYGVGSTVVGHEHMRTLGEEGGVGFFVDKKPPVKVDVVTPTTRQFFR